MSKHPRLVIHNRKEGEKKVYFTSHHQLSGLKRKKKEFNPQKKGGKKIDQGLAVKEYKHQGKKSHRNLYSGNDGIEKGDERRSSCRFEDDDMIQLS
jgi:hypothetical protein